MSSSHAAHGPSAGSSTFEPAWVSIVDVALPIPSIEPATDPRGRRYRKALTYVCWSGMPVGEVWMDVAEGGVEASDHARSIWSELGADLAADAQRRGAALTALDQQGLGERLASDPPSDPVHVTVAIATRNRAELLVRCLDSLLAVDYPSFDVVVVDSAASTTATVDAIATRYRDAPVICIRERRPGLAIAHNRALAEATGEVVAFTDDDVVVDPGWLQSLATPFADERVGCVTGLILPNRLDTKAQWWLEGYAGYAKGLHRQSFDLTENRPNDRLFPYATGRLGSGANMAFRTSMLRRIGGFDPALGVGSPAYGGDDLAAFFEVLHGGHTLVYEPAAIVRHDHPDTEEALSRQVFGYGAGMTAYLTKTLIDEPTRVLRVVGRVPYALWHVFSSRSDRNLGRAVDFPGKLRLQELAGMVVGPIGYVRGRRRIARSRGTGPRDRAA